MSKAEMDKRMRKAMQIETSKSVLGMAEPETGFLKAYCDLAQELTDAPTHYHLFIALSLVGTILANRVYVPFGALKIYPNLWTILLAPSSVYRKSTAISIGSRVLNRVDESLVLPNEFTPEALVGGLVAKPQGVFIWNEFAGALDNFDRTYMAGTKAMLTDLYDCPEVYKRKLKDDELVIKNPCLSILTATAQDWFLGKCKEGDVRSGFLARFIYVPPFKKSHRIGIPNKIDGSKLNDLVKQLAYCKNFEGEVDVSKIKGKYEEWLFAHEDSLEGDQYIDTLSGFWSRLGIYALKFAMIYNVAEEGTLTLTESSFFKAIELIEILKNNVRHMVQEDWVFGRDAEDKAKLLRLIKAKPGIRESQLLKNSHFEARRFHAILNTLVEEESVEKDNKRLYLRSHDSQNGANA